jgi:PAS domain S-box-containing protein
MDEVRSPRRLGAAVRRFPRLIAVFAVFASLLGLITAWSRVHHVLPPPIDGTRMLATTAAMCVLAGIALWVVAPEPVSKRRRWIARACGLVICGICGAVLLEYATGLDLGIERLAPLTIGEWRVHRPSPQSVVALFSLGAAFVIFDTYIARRRPADYFAIIAGLIAMVALLGHLFRLPMLYAMPGAMPHIGLSVPSAMVLLALSLGILAARVDRGIASVVLAADAGGVVARRMLVGFVTFPPLLVAVVLGAHLGWYSFPVASAIVLLVVLAEASGFIVSTANRLSRFDTEARAVTVALRNSEERVRSLVEQAADAIFIADLDGRFIDVNEAASRLIGADKGELLGTMIADIVPPEDHPRIFEVRDAVLAGDVHVGEWTMRRRDGTYVPVEVSAKVVTGERWQTIVRDISERKTAEAALARAADNERRLRAELENVTRASAAVSESVVDVPRSDVDTVLRSIAEQARSLTGAELAAAALGRDPDEQRWVAVEMPAELAAAIGRVLGVGALHGETIRVADIAEPPSGGLPAGHPPIDSFLAVPIRHRDRQIGTLFVANKPGGFTDHDIELVENLCERVGVAVETAEIYTAEARACVWLREIVEQLPEGVIVVDAHGDITAMNRASLALMPAVSRIAEWGALLDIRDVEGNSLPVSEFPVMRALRSGEIIRNREYVVRFPDGRRIPFAASAGPIRDDQHEIVGAVVVVADVTERKELERLREEWVAIIAHDLRQPLNTILLWIDQLQPGTDAQRKAVERVRAAGWRMNRLISDMLDAAKILANQLTIDQRAADLVELARGALENARLAHPATAIHLISGQHEVAWVDPDRFHQILGNLVSNAIKYGTRGSPIRIEIESAGSFVEIGVVNVGEVPADELPQLFLRFARTREARASRTPGTGLGLYICKGLVEAHGGRIWLDVGRGTTAVRFTLPRPPESET